MSQPTKTIRIRHIMSLLALVLVAAAASPWADDAVTHAVHFRTAMSDFAQREVAPAHLLFAGVPPLA